MTALSFYPVHASVITWAFYVIDKAIFLLALAMLVDASFRPAPAYAAVGRGTKGLWIAILAVAALVTFAGAGLLSIFGLLALIAALVYLVDMRPKLRELGGRGGFRPQPPW